MENCDKAYSRPCLLEQHIRSHKDERPFLCTVPGCNKAFLRDSHLKTHILSHSVEKPLYCSFCGKGFNTNQHLNRHERTHVPSVRCTFQGCNEAFRRASQLRKHVSKFHTFRKEHICPYCPREFDLRSRLEAHIKKTHSKMPSYHCGNDGCSETFSSWQELQAHIKVSHKTITCYCGQKFSSEVILAEHMKTVHSNQPNIVAPANQQNVYQDQYTLEWVCRESRCGSTPVAFRDKPSLICHYQQFHGFVPEALQVQILTPGSSVGGLPSLAGTNVDSNNGQSQAQNHPYYSFQTQVQQQLPKQREPLTGSSTLIERLTGAGYDRNRRIMCPIPDCCYRFAREYDLRRHVKAKHPHIITESGRLMIDYISIPPLPSQSEMQSSSNTQSPVAFQPQGHIKMESMNIKVESLDESGLDNHSALPPLPNFSTSLSNASINNNVTNHTPQTYSPSLAHQQTHISNTPNSNTNNGNIDCLSQNHGSLEAFFSNDLLNGGSNIANLHIHLSNDLLNETTGQYSMSRANNQSFNYQNPKLTKSTINNFSGMTQAPGHSVGIRNLHSVSSPVHSSVNSQAPSLHPSRSNTPVYSSQTHMYPLNTAPSSISTPTGSSPHQSYVSRQNSPQSLSNIQQAQLLNPLSKTFSSNERSHSPQTIPMGTSQEIDPMILNGSM